MGVEGQQGTEERERACWHVLPRLLSRSESLKRAILRRRAYAQLSCWLRAVA